MERPSVAEMRRARERLVENWTENSDSPNNNKTLEP